MTWSAPWARVWAARSELRLLGRSELPEAAAFCEAAGPDGVLAGARIADKIASHRTFGEVWATGPRGGLRGVCWYGGSLDPVGFTADDVAPLASQVRARGRGTASIVGDARVVLPLFGQLADLWPRPREVREDQPLMAVKGPVLVEPDPAVRPARPEEIDQVVPAAAAMFTEELGFSPHAEGPTYRQRIADLIARGMTFVRMGPIPGQSRQGVQFKADLGAAIGGNVQVHGVWTHPALRGRGLATAGMAAVVEGARALGFTSISLYVNAYNAPALRAYRRVGFTEIGTWATVMM